ncbi:DHA2 family efflux MFS transporter permease subunit [Paenibacillus oenotherae]|uniref:DHA2 family efflux MFS transporter permease subunit n=1 Tax=Paenibacillus oenotherae TaxID=1435645 RepID=A0ABS7D1N1_9BACL|nr:DHA2 family efflux MFS transporter permease subunit [Paenibacillus oenotherae]MBW7473776.1 DHA2 family efflux MFS transporter permease subunit [Paenibacillus oenotherae]
MTKIDQAARPAAEFRISSIIVPLIAIIAGVFMVILDSTAMNVALTHLSKDFNSTINTLQWTISGYLLAQAAVIPLAGWLSDRYGAKNIFLLSVALFTIGSVLCALPNTAEWLTVFRILQGLGGGAVLPVSMAYVYRLSPPHKVGTVMGMMGLPILFAPAIGPTLSGWLVEFHSWRWIFLINLPIGILCVLLGVKYLPKIDRNAVAGMDWLGMILGPLAFAALSYGVSEGAHSWTSDKTLAGLIIGGLALIAFIIVELKVRTPLLELRVFRSVDFSLAIVVQWVGQFALYGAIFLLPQFLQQGRGFGAFDTGLILMPQAIASGLMMPVGGLLYDRIGIRWLVVAGLSLISGAIYQYSMVDATTTGSDLLLPLIMAGAGMGLMMMPLNTHLMGKAPRELVSRVTSITNGLQTVVNSLAVASIVTILTANITSRQAEMAATAKQGEAAAEPAQAALHAAILGFDDTFSVMILIAAFGALMGLALRRNKKLQDDAGNNKQIEFMHG